MNDVEKHPFEAYVPDNATVLIVGSFPGKEQTRTLPNEIEWFYGAKRNQFWKIISGVYPNHSLKNKTEKEELFKKAGIGIADVILRAKRLNNGNSDKNLEVKEFNYLTIESKLKCSKIQSIYFTSKYVEQLFSKHFGNLFSEIKIRECLPSPSPIYRRMNLAEKIEHYKLKLPQL